MAATIIMP